MIAQANISSAPCILQRKKEIFSRIFHTGIYGRIQQKLREADRTLYGRLEDNKTRCEEVIRQVTVPRTEEAAALEWEERWQSLKERYRTNGAELLVFLHQLSEESRRLEEETGRLEENAIQKLAAGQNHLELVKKEKRVLEEKSRLEAFGREMEARRREAAAAYESRKPELEDQIRRMQDALPLYAEQEKKRQAYETLEHQRTALTQNLKKMQNQLETCRTQEEILRNQEREAVEARAALAECRGRREQMERRQAVLQELGKCCEAERTWRKSLEKRQEKFQAAAAGVPASQISCIRTRPAVFWRCRRDFWRQSCRKENRARSAARWNTRLPAVWRQSRSGRNRWKRCVPGGMMPIRSRGQPLRRARRRRSRWNMRADGG